MLYWLTISGDLVIAVVQYYVMKIFFIGLVENKNCSMIFWQALQHGFFNFDTFDVDEYEHYEVSNSYLHSYTQIFLY